MDKTVKTDERYWDCCCDNNYIHLKANGNFCPACKAFNNYRQPDSRKNEIKAKYKPENDKVIWKDEIISATTFQLKHVSRGKGKIKFPFKCRFDIGDYVATPTDMGTIVELNETTGNCKIKVE